MRFLKLKFVLRLDIHMKIILYGWIDHLYFDNEESIHSMGAIHSIQSIIARLSLYILFNNFQLVGSL
jgi:hypothetical protein